MSSAPPDPEADGPPDVEAPVASEQESTGSERHAPEPTTDAVAPASGDPQEGDAAAPVESVANEPGRVARPSKESAVGEPLEDEPGKEPELDAGTAAEAAGPDGVGQLSAPAGGPEGVEKPLASPSESAGRPGPAGDGASQPQEKTEGLEDTSWLLKVAEAEATVAARRAGGGEAAAPGAAGDATPPAGSKIDARHPLARDILLNPTSWKIWPAVAVLRWLLRGAAASARRLVYRSRPSLAFTPAEIEDVAFGEEGVDLVLYAPGLAAPGSPLPYSDIERIIHDRRKGGGLARFLDMSVDRFMHGMENSLVNSSSAFAYARGGRSTSLRMAASLAGLTAPLAAEPNGVLEDIRQHEEGGAAALIGLFVGPISASGLAGCLRTVTGRETFVREFAGATVRVARPVRVGGPLSGLLGARCFLPEAGVDAIIHGDAETLRWVQDIQRRESLYRLAHAFIGSAAPEVRIYLRVNAEDVPPAALDGKAQLGGLAVLGKTEGLVLVLLSDPSKHGRII